MYNSYKLTTKQKLNIFAILLLFAIHFTFIFLGKAQPEKIEYTYLLLCSTGTIVVLLFYGMYSLFRSN